LESGAGHSAIEWLVGTLLEVGVDVDEVCKVGTTTVSEAVITMPSKGYWQRGSGGSRGVLTKTVVIDVGKGDSRFGHIGSGLVDVWLVVQGVDIVDKFNVDTCNEEYWESSIATRDVDTCNGGL
jgi:hypothetical protein